MCLLGNLYTYIRTERDRASTKLKLMENSLHIADTTNEQKQDTVSGKSQPKQCLVAAIPKHAPQNVFKRIIHVDQHVFAMGPAAEVGFFLLKLAVLEAVRRFSKSHCPILWRSLQALQFVCLPPLRWMQKWGFFRGLIKFMQALSRPILVLSISTSFSGRSTCDGESSDSLDDSQSRTDPSSDSLSNVESADSSGGVTQIQTSKTWISQLLSELEKEGMILPERITEDELQRFYNAANGDYSRFLASVKKTILWKESFRFLSAQELEGWSEIVFWHGHDVKGHPCLIVRIAPACSNIVPEKTSRLPEVVASQIEHGILHLVRPEDPLVTVLMDCEGLTPFRFPLQMMRSCAILLQDHYPNRLAALFIVRLPPVARIIAQTLFQVLRPGTRRKLRVLGADYKKVLLEHLEAVPSALGSECSCSKCTKLIGVDNSVALQSSKCTKLIGVDNNVAGQSSLYEAEKIPSPLTSYSTTDDFKFVKFNGMWKTVVIGLLILLICIIFSAQVHDLQGLRLYSRGGW